VFVTGGTGAFASGSFISSVNSATNFTVSATPTTALANASIAAIASFGSGVSPYTYAATTGADDIVLIDLTSVNIIVALCNTLESGIYADFAITVSLYRSPYVATLSPVSTPSAQLLYFQTIGTAPVFVSGVPYSFSIPVTMSSILDQPGSAGNWVYFTTVKWQPINGSFRLHDWSTQNWNIGATVYKR
jgi:hypothetical protein